MKNLHSMALRGQIDRKEWKVVLEDMIDEVKYALPVIEKGPDYIIIPYTDKEIPESYGTVVESSINDNKGETIWRTLKIYTAEPDAIDTVILSGGYPKAEQVEMTVNEIKNMIREIK